MSRANALAMEFMREMEAKRLAAADKDAQETTDMSEPTNHGKVIETWWDAAGLHGPFTPGTLSGSNDGIVRDVNGNEVATCWNEARADVIAAMLNEYAERKNSEPKLYRIMPPIEARPFRISED